jgi:ATP-dependent Clp protease ATP-binding subunit ClpA
MSHLLSIPFYGFKLKFVSGGHIATPMMHQQMVFPDRTINQLSAYFRKAFQTKVLDKGAYASILDQYTDGDFLHGEIEVEFTASKDKMSYPDFTLEFKYFYKRNERGFWAIVPVIGVEVFIDNDNDFDQVLSDTIRLEFIRKNRLRNVQSIVETMWYDNTELLQQEISLKFYTPAELARLNEEKKQEILPLVAQKIHITDQVLFGMKSELDQAARGLKGKYGKNVLLVGPSGVGKTTLIWELQRVRHQYKIVADFWETTASTLIKELTQNTGWQESIAYLCKDLSIREDILFIRNLMELFEVGQYEGNSVSMAEYLRSYLASGEITLITECTDGELAQIELRSPNYSSLFNVIRLEEAKEDLEDIILRKVNSIARLGKIKIEEEAVRETIRLNKRYTPYSGFPGKPIRFLENIIINHEKGISKEEKTNQIGRTEVIRYFSEETGMPLFMVDPAVPMDPAKIKMGFKQNLFGQDHCIDAVVDVFAAVKTALTRQGKPIASFLFVGPTGVGKTEMAKIMANFMFGGRDKIIRFDMSEYSDPYSVMRLTGAGYHSEGLLTAAVRREPFAVLLFDEIEKADSSFYDLLLQVLGEGRLSDSQGKLANFCSTMIVMTSNIGAASLQSNRIGWDKGIDTADVNAHFVTSVEKHFRPELFNRIDRVIPFSPLGRETMRFVVEREMGLFKKREGVKFRKMTMVIDDEVLDYLADKGYDEKYGARFLQRAVREKLVAPLSKKLNYHDYNDQLDVLVSVHKPEEGEESITIHVKADAMQLELMLEELQRNNAADLTADFRRSIYTLTEGNVYVKLLSELDMLESKKRKKKTAFWKSQKNAEDYAHYLGIKEKMERTIKEIEEYEMDLALMVMDLKPYQPTIFDEVKAWEKKYENVKVELFAKLHPEYNECHIALMGVNPERLLEFYLPIIEVRGLEIEGAKTLWFKESYYNETVIKKEERVVDGKKEIVETAKPRKDYYSRPLDFKDKERFEPKKKNDIFCGITFFVKSPAIYLYFEPEKGRIDWNISSKERNNYFVQIETREPNYPIDVHRKEFFTKKAQRFRRIISPDKLRDYDFKITRDIPKGNHHEFIQRYLDQLFRKRLDEEILGEG